MKKTYFDTIYWCKIDINLNNTKSIKKEIIPKDTK